MRGIGSANRTWCPLLVTCFCATLATRAEAQQGELPQGTVPLPPPDAWQHNIVTDGFLAAQRRQSEREKQKTQATQLSISFGAMLSGGNARFFGASADQRFRVRRDQDQFSQRLAANYSSAAQPGKSVETTVENVQGRTRYDRFFSDNWVAFIGLQGRHDRFQGLDLRLQLDPGIGYYLVNGADERLWVECG